MNFFENTQIHEHSAKLYNSKLNEWISYMPTIYQSLSNIIMYPELAMKQLESHLKVNTNTNRHIYIVAVMSFIKHKKDMLVHLTFEQYSAIRIKWININTENEAPIVQRRLENKPTDMQLKKGGSKITFEEITEKRDTLPIGSIERLLISMYTMIPPARADYFSTQIVRDDEIPTEKNYIRIRGTEYAECILTDFKTARQFKKITHIFPAELVEELHCSLKKTPRSYLFINTRGEPHTRNSFVLWTRRCLTRIFETDFTLVFFRHAFVTNYINNKITSQTTDAEIKEVSDRMGHSPDMFRAYKWIKSGAKGEFEVGGED
jgi:hypothetical protein